MLTDCPDTQVRRRVLLAMGSAAIVGALHGSQLRAAPAATQLAPAPQDGAVHLPARVISPPKSISEQAKEYLKQHAKQAYEAPPPAHDSAAWRKFVADHNNQILRRAGDATSVLGVDVETITMGGVTVHVASAAGSSTADHRPHLSIHGGGWVSLSGRMARLLAMAQALQYGGRVYGVDYRTPPDHPFPAPLDDCLTVYREILKRHAANKVLVAGGSAGGNLAAALMLKARDVGLPPPGALFLDTPVSDLTSSSDSLQTNQDLDVLLKRWDPDANVAVYAAGADPNNPYLSPLKGDLSRGFPPTYLRTGTRDLFLSDTVRMHAALRKAGVEADLYVGEAMPHGGFGQKTPEDEDARADTLRWLKKHWLP